MLPQRSTGTPPVTNGVRKSGSVPFTQALSFEGIKTRVLAKLEDRLSPSASKRMPPSLLRQSLRTHAEQVAELDARHLPKADRDRLIETVLAELLGYGPLEELFRDPTVLEVMVTGPQAVIVRREQTQWMPTSIKFRDEEHVRWSLDKLTTHADQVGGMIPSSNLFDLKLPNGFRAIGIIPPPGLDQPATVAFIRSETHPAQTDPLESGPPASAIRSTSSLTHSASASTRSASPAIRTTSDATTPPITGSRSGSRSGIDLPGSPALGNTPSDSTVSGHTDPLGRHRLRIVERLISKLASLGVYDLEQLEITELRKVIAAYVREYTTTEKIYLSETDQGRLMLEILTTMHR